MSLIREEGRKEVGCYGGSSGVTTTQAKLSPSYSFAGADCGVSYNCINKEERAVKFSPLIISLGTDAF